MQQMHSKAAENGCRPRRKGSGRIRRSTTLNRQVAFWQNPFVERPQREALQPTGARPAGKSSQCLRRSPRGLCE
jgi:hypothetical protein